MNLIQLIDTDYLRSSQTIETILVSNLNSKQVYYVYNYEGYSFRVFETILSLINFFQGKNECFIHFDNETELDDFLANVAIG